MVSTVLPQDVTSSRVYTHFLPDLLHPQDPLPPCRSLCLAAQDGCEELMNKFGFQWPANLACHTFPTAGSERLCVGDTDHLPSRGRGGQPAPRPSNPYTGGGGGGRQGGEGGERGMEFVCPAQLQVEPELKYKLVVGSKAVADCGAPCDHMFFTSGQREFSRWWVGCWSVLCLASCAFTLLSFLIDCSR